MEKVVCDKCRCLIGYNHCASDMPGWFVCPDCQEDEEDES